MVKQNLSCLFARTPQRGPLNVVAVLWASTLLFWGCATVSPPTPIPTQPPAASAAPSKQPPAQWQCDPTADKAMENGDIETGLHEHARFVAQHPENPLGHYHMGYAFGQVGEIQQEIAHYETALALGYIHNEQLFFNLAMAYSELGQFDKAVSAFQKALALEPDSVDTLSELGRIYHETGDIENERRTLVRLLKLEPDNPETRKRLKKLPEK